MTQAYPKTPEVTNRLVVELRYLNGELYWDRSGAIARKLASNEGWYQQGTDANGCHISHEDDNVVFTYTPSTLSLSQSQSREVIDLWSPGEFGAKAEEFASEVIKILDLKEFLRIGFRQFVLIQTDSLESAGEAIGNLSLFRPMSRLKELGALSKFSHTVEIVRSTRNVRLAVSPFEQQVAVPPSVFARARSVPHKRSSQQRKALVDKYKAKKAIESFPRTGILFDLDAYIEDPVYPDVVTIREFVSEAHRDFQTILSEILVQDQS